MLLGYGTGMKVFQKVALAALIFTLILMFVGPIVRVSGAGMGCPDWPKCWGQYIPPTSVEQVDVDKLPLEKFKKQAEKYGRDPESVTPETLVAEFNPVHTWIEFVNRLCSLPIGIFTMLTFVMSLWRIKSRPVVPLLAFAAVVLVGVNAWMGATVVASDLQPGRITTHMALAILLLCVQVAVVWLAREEPWKVETTKTGSRLKWIGLIAFVFIFVEGVMGSQIREMTDYFKNSTDGAPRSEWVAQLEQTWMYVVHRSFSWVVLLSTTAYFWVAKKERIGGAGWHEKAVLGIVIVQMVLGLILAQIGIKPAVQVLHIALSSILVTVFFHWLLAAFARNPRV